MNSATRTIVALVSTLVLCAAAGPGLVWQVETTDGGVIASRSEDVPINPASVVKIATSAWALDRMGARHRFTTSFATNGSLDLETGRLEGDLIVQGGGDPDFHVENAYLVARGLNRIGVRTVTGDLRVDDLFWIGWEGGSERREKDAGRRTELMAERLRKALDPRSWSRETRKDLNDLAARKGFDGGRAPSVVIEGKSGRLVTRKPVSLLAVHRSNPLAHTLKRLNAYSNNDIERLGATLGSADELGAWLRRKWGASGDNVSFSTLSGLGVNRLTPKQVVRLLREFRVAGEQSGLRVEDLLPAIGCDPGTLKHFSRLGRSVAPGSIVAKTGTLTTTDGGVVVLAGVAHTATQPELFCVAAPGAGSRLTGARSDVEQWLLDRVLRRERPAPRECGLPVGFSDAEASVITLQ